MPDNLEEKKSADGYSTGVDPVTPAGGKAKQSPTDADEFKDTDPKNSEELDDGTTKKTKKPEVAVEDYDNEDKVSKDDDEMEESFDLSSLFEGQDLSEDFKNKATMVFEAAVNEAATTKASKLAEEIETDLKEQFETSLSESLDEIVDNLDGYLDYVVKEWMEENKVAIDSGIKVEMAESLMVGLKELFYEHNLEIDEDKIDVVSELEEELETMKETANKAINEQMELEEQIQQFRAEKIFETMTENLSQSQIERFRVLSEKLDHNDLDEYSNDLKTLKESFFKTKSETVVNEDLDKEGEELIVEDSTPKRASPYDSVNAYAKDLKSFK